MDSLLKELLALKNAIDCNGWIIIPPAPEGILCVQVKWFLAEERVFEMNFSNLDIERQNTCLATVFIDHANRYINECVAPTDG